MASVVITGGQGFVGQYVAEELAGAGWKVVQWDLPEVDITRADTFREKLEQQKPDWLIHLAALASVGASFTEEVGVHKVNVDGTVTLLQQIQAVSSDTRVIIASSADIYGAAANTSAAPLKELSLTEAQPTSPYAKSKYEMEQIIEKEFPEQTIRVRPFPHIGPRQREGFVTADFASQIAAIEQGTQSPVIHVGNLEAVRDFTDVRDVARAYRLLLEKGELGEVYNIGSGVGTKIGDVLNVLLAQSKTEITVEHDKEHFRPSDTPQLIGDASKLTELTDWQPTITLEQSLHDILTWWREHPVH